MSVRERGVLHGLALYALCLLALHAVGPRLPAAWAFFWYPEKLVGPGGRLNAAEWLWGVYAYTYLPPWLQWLALALAATAVVWAGFAGDAARWRKQSRAAWERLAAIPFPQRSRGRFFIAGLSLFVFYLARVPHTRWGDAYLLVKGMAHPDVRLMYNWQAPLDTFIHALLFRWGEAALGWSDALPAYWIISSLAGAFAVWVLLQLAGEVGQRPLARWAIFLLMISLGSVQLFFGYPENYTLISLFILIYFWLAWRYVQGRGTAWGPSLILALAHGFHPSTLVLQPSLWLLAFLLERRRFARTLPALLLPPLFVIAGVFALMSAGGYGLDAFLGAQAPGGGDHRWLVPLTQVSSDWEYYTMFSRGHLMDFLNQQLLVAPFTLPLLLLLALFVRDQLPRDAYAWFLLTAALAYLALIWLWNPDYGGQRDWDLFSVASWSTTLLAGYWLTRVHSSLLQIRALLIILSVQILHTAAWVYSNTLPWEWPT
ncbi:MAG: hypothetical protein GXP42_03545 [Chloroflexi bacterium]|nr:hypothetical protein [Chloroflexota bacterium]